MANWKHRITLKDLLSENEDPETVIQTARGFYERLECWRQEAYPEDEDLEEIVDCFHTLGWCEDEPTCQWFNSTFSDLYDWADQGHRLWID